VDREQNYEQFHDSELGDVYDLYNACNGVLAGGRLDVSRLDELGREEAEALDLQRLREVWQHTVSGCRTCEDIIRTLHSTRTILRERLDEFPR